MRVAFTPFNNATRNQKRLDWSLSAGESIIVLQDKGGWSEVENMEKDAGWVPTNKVVKM